MVDSTGGADSAADSEVREKLAPDLGDLEAAALTYHLSEPPRMNAIYLLTSKLLPAIFRHSEGYLSEEYKNAIDRDPRLIEKLYTAHMAGAYDDIRQLGSCSSDICLL